MGRGDIVPAYRRIVSVPYRACTREINEIGVLYLSTSIRAHSDVSVRPTCETGVDACAECSFTLFAIQASAVSDVEGHDDAVAFLKERDATAGFVNNTHVLVACKFDLVKRATMT